MTRAKLHFIVCSMIAFLSVRRKQTDTVDQQRRHLPGWTHASGEWRPASQRVVADVANLDVIDGHGGPAAVGQGNGDELAALLELIALTLPDGPIMLGDRRRLCQEPAAADPWAGEDRDLGCSLITGADSQPGHLANGGNSIRGETGDGPRPGCLDSARSPGPPSARAAGLVGIASSRATAGLPRVFKP